MSHTAWSEPRSSARARASGVRGADIWHLQFVSWGENTIDTGNKLLFLSKRSPHVAPLMRATCYLLIRPTRHCVSRNTNILRTAHSDSLSGTFRQVKSSPHAIGNSPRSG